MNMDSCVLWLEKAMQGGKWIDQSKYNNNGAMIGARFKESAIEFDGVDDYVNCGSHTSLGISQAITVEALVNIVTGNNRMIVSKYDSGIGERCYVLGVSNVGNFGFDLGNADGTYKGSVTFPAIFDEWCHVVGTYDLSNMKLYMNGAIKGNQGTAGTIGSFSLPLLIGDYTLTTHRFLEGAIALVRIYNKALTAQQVKELYEQTYRKV